MSTNTKKKRKSKKQTEEVLRRGLKHSASFTWSLLINVVLVFIIVKLFSYSFNFTYTVFSDATKAPGSSKYVVVEIPADSSVLQIGEALEENEIIDDKYIFFAKVKVKGYADKIKAGKYGLSASMSMNEILNVLCDIKETTEEE